MTFTDGSTFDYEVSNGDSSLGGKIDTVKVNGVELPVVDKAVDIEIPEEVYIGNTEPTDESVVLWINPDETGDSADIEIPEEVYIGNTEPIDENVVLWINPDETGGTGGGSYSGTSGIDIGGIKKNQVFDNATM